MIGHDGAHFHFAGAGPEVGYAHDGTMIEEERAIVGFTLSQFLGCFLFSRSEDLGRWRSKDG